jgi:hypothetical protein
MSAQSTASDELDDHGRTDTATDRTAARRLRWGSSLLVVAGLLFTFQGLGTIYRGYFQTRFEPGVHDLGGVTAHELAQQNPAVQSYIDHLAVNLGALMVVGGIAMVALVWFGVRDGQVWAYVTTLVFPVGFLLVTLPVHQTVHFHFDQVLHLGPAGIGTSIVVAGAVLAYLGLQGGEPTTDASEGDR